uniref:Thrombopoietin n=1 Tax=Neogobius melanostomus TaxID=47308 RepID=A0A8C6TFA2_9GOBI
MAVGSLLLLCVVTSWPWDAQTKPIAFVCNKPVREALNIVSWMESELLACEGLATLPQAVQLPCTALHAASWENKSLQQKRGDLVASLRILNEGVESVSALSQTPCATSVLQKLLQNIGNYLLILTHLHLSGAEESPVLSCVPRSTRSMSTVLQTYSRLSLANWSASWTT